MTTRITKKFPGKQIKNIFSYRFELTANDDNNDHNNRKAENRQRNHRTQFYYHIIHLPQKQQQNTNKYKDINIRRTSVRSNTKSLRNSSLFVWFPSTIELEVVDAVDANRFNDFLYSLTTNCALSLWPLMLANKSMSYALCNVIIDSVM